MNKSKFKFSYKLKNKTKNEIIFIICQSQNVDLIEKYLTLEEDKIYCYHSIYKNDYNKFLQALYKILIQSQDDMIKNKYVSLLRDEDDKERVILSISDPILRGLSIGCLSIDEQDNIIKTIEDQEILKKIYFQGHNLRVLCAICDDNMKSCEMRNWDHRGKVEIICSLSDENYKYFYSKYPEFKGDLLLITNSIKSFEIRRNIFNENNDLIFKLNMLEFTEKIEEYNELLEKIPDCIYKDIFYMQREENKKLVLKHMELDKKRINNNKDLVFQVAIDVDISNAHELAGFYTIFNNWNIQKDKYYFNKIKIVSPKLSYTSDSFKELKLVSDFLKKYNCQAYMNTNMSIKYNVDYFDNIEELADFIKLYTISEEVLGSVCNRAGNGEGNNQVLPFQLLIRYLSTQGINFTSDMDICECIEDINSYTDTNNYSLNFLDFQKDGDMLEIKMADNELDFNELSNTIILFAKLMEKAKLLTNINKKSIAFKSNDKDGTTRANKQLLINCLRERKNILEIYNMFNYNYINLLLNEYNSLSKSNCSDDQVNTILGILFDNDSERRIYEYRYKLNCKNIPYQRKYKY